MKSKSYRREKFRNNIFSIVDIRFLFVRIKERW